MNIVFGLNSDEGGGHNYLPSRSRRSARTELHSRRPQFLDISGCPEFLNRTKKKVAQMQGVRDIHVETFIVDVQNTMERGKK